MSAASALCRAPLIGEHSADHSRPWLILTSGWEEPRQRGAEMLQSGHRGAQWRGASFRCCTDCCGGGEERGGREDGRRCRPVAMAVGRGPDRKRPRQEDRHALVAVRRRRQDRSTGHAAATSTTARPTTDCGASSPDPDIVGLSRASQEHQPEDHSWWGEWRENIEPMIHILVEQPAAASKILVKRR